MFHKKKVKCLELIISVNENKISEKLFCLEILKWSIKFSSIKCQIIIIGDDTDIDLCNVTNKCSSAFDMFEQLITGP